MTSITCINELEDAVLGFICDMVDSISIVELLRVGNRLLTLKLCSPYGISRYCDIGEYGSYIGPLQWILPQLNGLKTVSITSNRNASVESLLVDLIPSSVTSIELVGRNTFEACFETRNGKEEHFLNFSSRFPSLQSLSLLYSNPYLEDHEAECESEIGHDEDRNKNNDQHADNPSNNGDNDDYDIENDNGQLPSDHNDSESNLSAVEEQNEMIDPPDENSNGDDANHDDVNDDDDEDSDDSSDISSSDDTGRDESSHDFSCSSIEESSSQDSSWVEPDYGGMTPRSWLDVHIPLLPSTLTRLCLNSHSWRTPIGSIQFPATLEYLEIGCRVLNSLTWIFSLPLLHTLKLVRIGEVEDLEESFENLQHSNLTTLHFSFLPGDSSGELSEVVYRMESLFPALLHLQDFGMIPYDIDSYRSQDYKGVWRTSLNTKVNLKTLSCPYTPKTTLPETLTELRWLRTKMRLDASSKTYTLSRDEVVRLPPTLTILYAPHQQLERNDFELLPRTLTSLTISSSFKDFKYSTLPPLLTYFDACSYLWRDKGLKAILKYLPHLNTLAGCGNRFYIRTSKNLSFLKTGWTDLMYATYMEDFDALHRLVVEYMKLPDLTEEKKLDMIWRDVYADLGRLKPKARSKIQHPLTSLNWFRLRGLCSLPHRVDEVSFYKLLHINTRQRFLSTRTFWRWAIPYIADPD